MKKRYFLLFVLLFLIGILRVNAAYISNYTSKYTNPDGKEVTFYITGDEYFRYAHDKNKNVLVKNDMAYYTYATIKDGKVVSTNNIYDMKSIPSKTIKVSDIDLEKNKELVHNFDNQIPKKSSFKSSKKRSQREGSIENVLNYNSTVIFIRFKNESEFVNSTLINSLSTVLGKTNNDSTGLKSYVNKVTEGHVNTNSNLLQINNNNYYSYVVPYNRGYLQAYSSYNTIGYTTSSEGDQRLISILNAAVSSLPETATSNVDANGDGYIDNFIFIMSGNPDGWGDSLWPHKWNLRVYGSELEYSGAMVDTYNLQFAGNGDMRDKVSVFCHETMHSLGLPDLYRYNYDGDPVGPWDMMNIDMEGSYVNTHIRNNYGITKLDGDTWSQEPSVINKSGYYELNLASSNSGVRSYRINTINDNQFIQLEYRGTSGDVYDSNIPYNGLLISRINTAYEGNEGNDDIIEDEYYIYRPNDTQNNVGGLGDLDNAAIVPCADLSECSNIRGSIDANETLYNGALTLENGTNTKNVIRNVEYISNDKIGFSVYLNGDIVYLKRDHYTGAVGSSYHVTPVYLKDSYQSQYPATCTSSDTSIAVVSYCNVLLVSPGSATITVTINGKKYYSEVEVLPSQVTGFNAVINDAKTITLSYDVTGNPADSFLIYRSSDGINYELLTETIEKEYIDNDFVFGNTYYYKIGYKYNEVEYETDGVIVVNTLSYLPKKPIIEVEASSVTSGLITINGDKDANGYNIYVSDNPIGPFELYDSTTSLTYTIDNIDVAKTYYIKVSSFKVTNEEEYESDYSDVAILNTREELLSSPKITNIQAISESEVKITYTPNTNATGYNIYVSKNNKDFELLKEDNKEDYYIHDGVEFGKTYYYKVSSILDNNYEGYKSNSYKIIVNQITPQNFKVTSNTYNSIRVSYDPIASASGYEIYYSQDNKKFYKLATTKNTSYIHNKLKYNKNYYYKVRSYKEIDGIKIYSNYTLVLKAKPLSQAPKVTVSQLDDGKVKLNYSSDSSANNYKIYLKIEDGNYSLISSTKKKEFIIKNLSLGEDINIKVVSYKNNIKGNETNISYSVTLRNPVAKLNTNTNTISIDGVKDATSYSIYKCSDECNLITNTNGLTYTSEEINNNDIYSYYVVAINDDYVSNKSNVVTNSQLFAINSFNAVSSNSNEVKISVNSTISFDGYELYVSNKKDKGFKKVSDFRSLEIKYNKVSLDKTYYFKIRPYKIINNIRLYGKLSGALKYKHSLNKINSIKLTNNTSTSVKITFDKVNGAKGYYLYYSDGTSDYRKIATLKTNSYIHSNLSFGQMAYYKVKSYMVVNKKTITSPFGNASSIEVKSSIPNYNLTSFGSDSIKVEISGETNAMYAIEYGTSENNLEFVSYTQSNSYIITGLNPATVYYFRVSIRRNGTNGDGKIKSHRLSAITPEVSYDVNDKNTATLHFNNYSDNSYYEVYLHNNKIYDGTNTSLVQENLVTGKEYDYKVRSYIIVNEEKEYSDFKDLVVRCYFDRINDFVVTVNTNLNRLNVDFESVSGNDLYYKLLYTNELYTSFKELATSTTNRFSNVSVNPGKIYYLKVVAVSVYNDKEYYYNDSDYVMIKTLPKTVDSISAKTNSYNSIKVNWSSEIGVSGYELYSSKKANSGFKKILTTTATSYVNKKLKLGTKYYYKIRTYKTIGGKKYYSSYSSVAFATPLTLAPTNLKISRYQYSATKNIISWKASSNASGYYVYRSSDGINYTNIGTTSSTKFIDKKAYWGDVYYKVRSYKKSGSKKYLSTYSSEVYMNKAQTPNFSIFNDSDYYSNAYYIVKLISNYGSKNLTILSSGAYSINPGYSVFDRKMSLVNVNNGRSIKSQVILPGSVNEGFAFKLTSPTWVDDETVSYFYILYDGVKYKVRASYYYGNAFDFA